MPLSKVDLLRSPGGDDLLHPELLDGSVTVRMLLRDPLLRQVERLRSLEIGSQQRPSLSIVIRSRNNMKGLQRLLDDVDEQAFSGDVEVIVVDSGSNDGSIELAQDRADKVVSINQAHYSHPVALNAGFMQASNEWVLSLVDHSLLAHSRVLQLLAQWSAIERVAGISGIVLPGINASNTERLVGTPLAARMLRRPPCEVRQDRMGILATNCSAFRKSVWESLDGFDEQYGAGGEDGAFCRAALSDGWTVVLDPALSVHHSHGLGPVESVRQVRHWSEFGHPNPFSLDRLLSYRSDLRQ